MTDKTQLGVNPLGREYYVFGTPMEDVVGFSRVLMEGRWIFVAATAGNYEVSDAGIETPNPPKDVFEQARQAFDNVKYALNKAGSSFEEVVRCRVIIANQEDVATVRPLYKKYFGEARPVFSLMCSPLPHPDVKVEVEVTAIRKE